MATLELTDITKVYDDAQGRETAVDGIDLKAEDGEFIVLVGPSGCGKSTTLRMLAGLETVTSGTIDLGGREVQTLVPSERSIAMVFQSYALYTKMTARENMAYGLKHSTNLSKTERASKVEEAADLLDIRDLLEDRPEEMSGGQKQRVALGRAIVRDPDAFLLDEPLSNLDAKLRARMRTELQRIQSELDVTTVYVTHDQTEAMTMADRIAVMNDGTIQQVDPPEVAYDHPTNEFVATFLGSPSMNTFKARVDTTDDAVGLYGDDALVASVPQESVDLKRDHPVTLGFRPEDIRLFDDPSEGTFSADVVVSEYQGNDNFIHLSAGELELTARVPPDVYPNPGERVGITVAPRDVFLFDPDSGTALKTRGTASRASAQQQVSTSD